LKGGGINFVHSASLGGTLVLKAKYYNQQDDKGYAQRLKIDKNIK